MAFSGIHYAAGKSRRMIIVRLSPEVDLVGELTRICEEFQIKAGCIASAIGSLKYATFQSVAPDVTSKDGPLGKFIEVSGPLELLTASGTITTEGTKVYLHIHAIFMDKDMRVVGGHLEPGGNPILNTAELSLIETESVEVRREMDSETRFIQSFPLPLRKSKNPIE